MGVGKQKTKIRLRKRRVKKNNVVHYHTRYGREWMNEWERLCRDERRKTISDLTAAPRAQVQNLIFPSTSIIHGRRLGNAIFSLCSSRLAQAFLAPKRPLKNKCTVQGDIRLYISWNSRYLVQIKSSPSNNNNTSCLNKISKMNWIIFRYFKCFHLNLVLKLCRLLPR